MAAIILGRLVARGRDPARRGLAQALFHPSDVEAFLDDHRPLAPEGLTIPEAADRLGIKQQVAYDLVDAGLLPTTTSTERGQTVQRVKEADLAAFAETYVTAKELAKRWETSPRQVVQRMKEQAVTAVTGPEVDGRRQYFFVRQETDGRLA